MEGEKDECEFCGGEGVVYEDEYENGQIVGVGTVDRVCICQKKEYQDD